MTLEKPGSIRYASTETVAFNAGPLRGTCGSGLREGTRVYSATLLDHFQNPRNAGELAPPAVTIEVTNPACGDILRLSLVIVGGRIGDVRFKAKGCVPSIACGSLLTELIKGKSPEEAARVSSAEIERAIGGLPPASGHAAVLAVDALKQALQAAGKEGTGNR
jgi:nitrogen fixation protein NifU and related proteins